MRIGISAYKYGVKVMVSGSLVRMASHVLVILLHLHGWYVEYCKRCIRHVKEHETSEAGLEEWLYGQ